MHENRHKGVTLIIRNEVAKNMSRLLGIHIKNGGEKIQQIFNSLEVFCNKLHPLRVAMAFSVVALGMS